MDNKKSECIGVATFNIDGETKQFGLTQEDFDMFMQRTEKLQENIKSMAASLKHFSEEKVRLENVLTVISQPEASFQAKD